MKRNKFLSLAFLIGALVLCCVLFAACGGRKLASFSVESASTNYTLVDDTVTVVYGEDYSRLPEQLSVIAAFDDETTLSLAAEELAGNGFSLESNIPAGEKTPAGSYTLVIRSADLNESKTITLVVQKTTATLNAEQLSWSENEFTYDGAEKCVEITNLPSGFSVTYENNTATTAGEYTATATIHVVDSQNYSFEALVLSCPFEIILGENRVTLMVDEEEYRTVYVRYGDEISVTEPTKQLYDFAGWYTAEDEQITAVTSDMTLYAKWTLKEEYKPFEFTVDDHNGVTITGVKEDYRSATSLRIPDAVVAIAEDALKDLTALTSLTIGSDVKSIGWGAFAGCTALTEIYYNAIACADLAVVKYPDTKGYFDHAGTEADGITLTIGKNVKKIPAYLFRVDNSADNSVKPPNITQIVFAEGLTGASIGAYAFANVKSLTSVAISGVSTIGEYAFAYCQNLVEVTIGSDVTEIGKNAFKFAYRLERIYFNATQAEDLAENVAIFMNAGQTSGAITLTIGANVQKTPANLFSTESISTSNSLPRIKTVIFEEGSVCTSIGESAFAYLVYLESVTLPNTELEIGEFAFYNCTALTGVTLPAKLKSLGKHAFNGTALTSITLPAGLESVGSYAFSKCTALTVINYNIKTYDDLGTYNGFFENAGVTEGITLRIGANVEKIPANFFRSAKIKEVIFEEGSVCTSIGAYAFRYCETLTGITLTEGLTNIGAYAFAGCTALAEINYNITECVNLVKGESIFNGSGTNGITLRIGAKVKEIPANFFYQTKIKEVIFEENSVCTSIGNAAFYQCTSLATITLPDSITSIGNGAFYQCSSLTTITLPDGVTSIEANAFKGCSALVSVNIPKSVTSIGDYAFQGCGALTAIYYNAKNCADLEETSTNRPFDSAGQGGDGITVTIGKDVVRIPAWLFHNPYSDTSLSPKIIAVVFEKGSKCTTIGKGAFGRCKTLKWITLPSSITSIDGAFYECDNLEAAYYAGETYNETIEETFNGQSSLVFYYYSEQTPAESGQYWHYVDGVPTAWTTA